MVSEGQVSRYLAVKVMIVLTVSNLRDGPESLLDICKT